MRAFASVKFADAADQIVGSEIGPAFFEEDEFGEGAFPQKKIGEALLASGAD